MPAGLPHKEIQRGESGGRTKLGFTPHDHEEPPLVVKHRRSKGNRSPQRFVSLHHHSTFSYLDGYALPEAHVRRVGELNMSALALTEHGNVASHVKLQKAALKAGIKPIFGIEAYTGYTDEARRTQMKNHLTILARDLGGYRNILRLVSLAYSKGFYYEATVDDEMLAAHREGLVVLSGCQGSELFTSLVGGKHIDPDAASYRRARAVAKRHRALFGEHYFIEVQAFPELESTRRANPLLARLASELRVPLVATMDVHYTAISERQMQKLLHTVRGGAKRTIEEQDRKWGYEAALAPPASDLAIYRRLRATGLSHRDAMSAIDNTALIAQDCNVELPRLPPIKYPNGSIKLFERWLEDGWHYRGFHNMPPSFRRKAKRQLEKERKVIEGKDFVDYFMVVSDAVRWAKDEGIAVGPARGSAAASLVCYLLRITEVNPLEFPNLVFERFIDVTRQDLPDIDLDFDSERRSEVRAYLVDKYGAECVNNIGTFYTYKAKMALDDVARASSIPKYVADNIKGMLIERSSGDLRASATIEDTANYFPEARKTFEEYPDLKKAIPLEGNVKGFGVHAAGLVISNGPITEVASVIARRRDDGSLFDVVEMDKYDAEEQGLLKLDFLGLSTVTMLAEACRHVGMEFRELYDLSRDDEAVIDAFRQNDVSGIFQFEGRATRSICGALRPDSFDEICDTTALSRPGPLHNGAAGEYVDIKRGLKDPESIHPMLDAITEHTKYQVIYQEQILRIVREIGGFSWTHAAYIRKIISRKIGDAEFNRQWATFLSGAKKNGMDEDTAKEIWGLCITAGSYAFNFAHTAAYGLLSYWSMWFKVHYPSAFYAAFLSKMPNRKPVGQITSKVRIDSHTNIMRDAERHGVEFLPPSVKRSGKEWTIAGKKKIRGGFMSIPGIAEKKADQLVRARDANAYTGWDHFLAERGVGIKSVEAWRLFAHSEDPYGIGSLSRMLTAMKGELKSYGLPLPNHTADTIPYEKGRDEEVIWLGIVLFRNLRDLYEQNRARTGEELDASTVRDPHLNEWVIMQATDDTGEILTVRVDRWKYPSMKRAIWGLKTADDAILVHGVKPGWQNSKTINVHKMWVLSP